MVDLKRYYDRCVAAEAEVQRIAAEMESLLEAGGDENESQALGMQGELNAAIGKLDEAGALYESMQRANRPNDAARNFVPVSSSDPAGGEQPSTIKRSEYEALEPANRARFIRTGGRVED